MSKNIHLIHFRFNFILSRIWRIGGMVLKIIPISILLWSARCVFGMTLCNNFWSYSWSFMSKECYDDPIYDKNISEIIRSWGFTAEEHYLTTEDGYKILVERSHGNITKETPIILVHGMFTNSLAFVAQGLKSLTQLLNKLGYDVWLLNYRGTKYSRGHLTLSTDQKEYWSYTIDDMGIHDVRTTVKYVNEITKKKPVYIGHSMGTTGFFVFSTSFPEEAQQLLKGMIGLAPVMNWRETRTIARFIFPIWSRIKSMIVYKIYHGEVHSGFRTFIKPLLKFTPAIYLAQFVIWQLFGDGFSQMDPISLPPTYMLALDSTGAEAFTQYFQIYESGIFQKYDYGKEKNLLLYGTEQPPAYDMSKISVPIAIFHGGNDVISTRTNSEQLYAEIQPSVRCGYRELETWGHSEFLMAKDVVECLYLDVIDKIEDIVLGKCQS